MDLLRNTSGDPGYHQSNTRWDHTPLRFSESNTLGHSRQLTTGNLYTASPEVSTTSHPRPNSGHQRQVSFLSWVSRAGSPNSSKNSSATFCRICHDGDFSERFISPCECTGSVGLVHRSCIEKWLSTANHDKCEICGHKYTISKHPRPFVQWICEPTGQEDQRNLIGDIICFMLLTPLATISAYLCATGARAYLKSKWSEAVGLICLSVFLVLIYLFWVLLTIRYHWQVWSLWQDNNQDIRLVETERPTVRPSSSAEIVVSQVDLGLGDASINMPTDHQNNGINRPMEHHNNGINMPMNCDDNKGSQTSISSDSALLNDQRNGYLGEAGPATPNCCRESVATQMSAPVCNQLDYKYNLDTPNDGSCENQSRGDFTIEQDTVALKDAKLSRRNSELDSISLHDSSLLGAASSYETFATASSVIEDVPVASSTPGNVQMNRKRSTSTWTPPRQTNNPPNQYLHPINNFIPQRTVSQPNLSNSHIYTVFSNPPSPEELRNNSSKRLKQNITQLRSTDSFSESETLPPYPSLEFIDVPRTSLISLPLPSPVLDSDIQPGQFINTADLPASPSDSHVSSYQDSLVIHRQLEIGDIQSTPILDTERPPHPHLSPNITIGSPKRYFSNAETTETRPDLKRETAMSDLPSSTACVWTEIRANSEEEDKMPAILGDKNTPTKLQLRNTVQECPNEIAIPTESDGTRIKEED